MLKDKIIEKVSEQHYINTAREHGITDDVAKEAYQENKVESDKLTALRIKKLADQKKGVDSAHHIDSLPNSASVSGQRLKAYIDRIERVTIERDNISADIKEIYTEAKATGLDTKIIKKLISLRKIETQKRREEREILELYAAEIQMDLF